MKRFSNTQTVSSGDGGKTQCLQHTLSYFFTTVSPQIITQLFGGHQLADDDTCS